MENDKIIIKGAKENNLKNISFFDILYCDEEGIKEGKRS